MRRTLRWLRWLGAVVSLASGTAAALPQPVGLRSEYRENPLAIDAPKPRLSWRMQPVAGRRGLRQTAYRVLAAGSLENLARDRGDLWDSGRVVSSQSIHVEYAGRPLASRQRVHWKVRVWDQDGQASSWSEPAFWGMGLLTAADWPGQWIGAPEAGYSAPLLRRQWTLPERPARATAHVTGLGYFELSINGRRVGDHVLDPGFTDYTRRVLYVSHDVTGHFSAGENAAGIVLGNGYYWLPTPDTWSFHKTPWRAFPKAMLHIDLEYADGRRQSLETDASWKWALGPTVFNCLRAGEITDLREQKPGWDKPGYDDSGWRAATTLPAPAGRLAAQQHPPIRVTGDVPAVRLSEPRPGVFVYDLGAEITGWPRFRARAGSSRKVLLTCNSKLNPDGTVDGQHLAQFTNGPFQTGMLVSARGGEGIFEPRFTYYGFRYVQVEGAAAPRLEDLAGRRVHTHLVPAGEFSSSDENLNRIHRMMIRTVLNNLHGIPTDCPDREKLGWMNDGFVAIQAVVNEFEAAPIAAKWIDDMLDAQEPGGHMPRMAPASAWARLAPGGESPAPADPWWSTSLVRAPWLLYLHHGDRRILERSWPAIVRFLDFVSGTAKGGLLPGFYGDWLDGSADSMSAGPGGASKRTPMPLTATAAWHHAVDLAGRIASVLGRESDARKYGALAAQIRAAFERRFLGADGRMLAVDSQTAAALALELGLAPEGSRAAIARQLADNIETRRAGHLSTGIVGTRFLPFALSENGRADLAYRVLSAEGFPGYRYMAEQGDTIWETWSGSGSRNHTGLTSPALWFYQALGGIRPDPSMPGFRNVILKPSFVKDLEWVKARHESPYGTIRSEWKRRGGSIDWDIEIPPNATATVYLPAGNPVKIESGERRFTIDP